MLVLMPAFVFVSAALAAPLPLGCIFTASCAAPAVLGGDVFARDTPSGREVYPDPILPRHAPAAGHAHTVSTVTTLEAIHALAARDSAAATDAEAALEEMGALFTGGALGLPECHSERCRR